MSPTTRAEQYRPANTNTMKFHKKVFEIRFTTALAVLIIYSIQWRLTNQILIVRVVALQLFNIGSAWNDIC